jgi:hypothetical protein
MFDLPPLPEVWGNYVIKGIEEVLSPQAISWWPQAPGWKYVAIILGLLAIWYGWRRWQWWLQNRYRREAARALQKLVDTHRDSPEMLYPLARLLKASALQAFERRDIAPLSGEAWVRWLNEQLPEAVFCENSSRLLARAQYRPLTEIDSNSMAQLVDQARSWIHNHRGPTHA